MKTKARALDSESRRDDAKSDIPQRIKLLRQTLGREQRAKAHRDDWGERSFNDKGFTER